MPTRGSRSRPAVSARSLVIAFALGVLLTLVVVAVSAWRVSAMTISTAIRICPSRPSRAGGGGSCSRSSASLSGLLLAVSGATSGTATPLMLGVSLIVVSLVPLLRLAGVPERLAFTACRLAVVVSSCCPGACGSGLRQPRDGLLGTWIVAGLMIVVGPCG